MNNIKYKYVVIIGDGMADRPLKELDGRTPLQVASTPNMDKLASKGILGKIRTIPEGMHPGSDVANLSILGYNPREYYSGRAPLEAASIGVELGENDVAYRCNLVTLKFNKEKTRAIMEDYSSGHISTEEAKELIKAVNNALGSHNITFYPGVSYRHLMVWSNGITDIECLPPHDILGKDVIDYLPVGKEESFLRSLMMDSVDILENHEINRERIRKGKNPANSIWLWGQGKRPSMPLFKDKYSVEGALVSAVDLTRGIGIYAGFEILNVPGITGYLDTNYVGKANATIDALKRLDFVYLHVEAPDEAGHSGNYRDKIKAIEDFDTLIVGTIMKEMEKFPAYRILLMPDHPTPIELRTHTADPVPFIIFDSTIKKNSKDIAYDETIVDKDDIIFFEDGHKLMDLFIKERF